MKMRVAGEWLKEATPKERSKAVRNNGHAIEFIRETATPAERLAAVTRNGCAIKHLHSPTSEERLAAVKRDGDAIQYFIEDATGIERLAAVTRSGWAIKHFIDVATQDEKLAALSKCPTAITYFKQMPNVLEFAAMCHSRFKLHILAACNFWCGERLSALWNAHVFDNYLQQAPFINSVMTGDLLLAALNPRGISDFHSEKIISTVVQGYSSANSKERQTIGYLLGTITETRPDVSIKEILEQLDDISTATHYIHQWAESSQATRNLWKSGLIQDCTRGYVELPARKSLKI